MQPARTLAPAAVAALALLAAACNTAPSPPDKSAPPPRPLAPTSAAAASSAASSAAAPPGEAPAPEATSKTMLALQGPWAGSYTAKKGTVFVPDKAKDTHAGDDGKVASGAGKVELTVGPGGEVRGKSTGALGDATLSGSVDEEHDSVRASWFPDDPTRANAMTGVVILFLKAGALQGKILVSGPDAALVREAPITFERSK